MTISHHLGLVNFDEIDRRAELSRRPSRPPDYQAESEALLQLAHEIINHPDNILQKLAEMALTLCRAHTAGISLLEWHDGQEMFRWEGLAGVLAAQRNHTVPRHASPCGMTIDWNVTQLVHRPGRYYPAAIADPPIVEALLIPFYVRGVPIGTIWAVAHDDQRQFDREDERLLKTLAAFASGAWQLWKTLQQQACALQTSDDIGSQHLSELHTIYQEAPVGLCVLDTNLRYARINNRLAEMNGLPVASQIGRTVREVVPHMADEVEPLLHRVLEAGESIVGVELHGETAASPGEPRTFRDSFFPIRSASGAIVGINVVAEDVTEQLHKEQQLRALAYELSRTEDRERQRLASAIHDNLSQLLAVALIRLERIQTKNDTPQVQKSMKELQDILGEALDTAQTLTEDLRPALLGHEDNLKAALQWAAKKMRRHGLSVVIKDDGKAIMLDEDVLLVTYQAVQELLWNVAKHAGTSEATVCIGRSGDKADIVVEDHGRGFDHAHPPIPQKGGFGLFSFRERLSVIGGHLEVTAVLHHGTRARIRVPLK